ncbi:MAG TPA: SDR family oxidoreductase [Chitinophagaceae bacterium]
MSILITGANGFLGHYLVEQLLKSKQQVIATGKGDSRLPFNDDENFQYQAMDFTDPFAVHDVFEKFKPSVVVHAGAMSKPDDCEKGQWQAYTTNVEATITLLVNAEECKAHFIFISTDFVFSGEEGMYKEDDEPGPVNFYGKTKLEAEEAVKEYEYDWSIVRTVLVYGKPQAGRGNILTVVKDKLEKGEEYSVFDDQVRTPTYVEDLASAIVNIIEQKAKGVYHISGEDVFTPYEMACKTADHLGYDRSLIKKVTAAEFSQPARRPLKTGFIIEKAKRELGYSPVSFEEGLQKTFS